MAIIDFDAILSECISIAKRELGKGWGKVQSYASIEFRAYTERVAGIMTSFANKEFGQQELQVYLTLQRKALENVFLTIKGVSLIAVQNTINGVISLVTNALATIMKIALPI